MKPAGLAIAAAALALSGCQTWTAQPTSPTPQSDAAWQAHQLRLRAIEGFDLQGRAADGRGVKADLLWQQDHDGSFDLRLSGPFGVGAVIIRGRADQVEIQTREGRYQTRDPESWMRSRLGWTFPVQGLRYWVLGLPAPDRDAQLSLDPQGRLAVLTQDGWTLHYNEYQTQQGLDLPRRLEAVHGELRLRLFIDRWADPGAAAATQ